MPIDWENVAEEIESVGSSQRSALHGQTRRAIEHLLKLKPLRPASPGGWIDTVSDAQGAIEDVLEGSLSLRREVAEIVEHEVPKARRRVSQQMARYGETPLLDLNSLSYSEEQVLGWRPPL